MHYNKDRVTNKSRAREAVSKPENQHTILFYSSSLKGYSSGICSSKRSRISVTSSPFKTSRSMDACTLRDTWSNAPRRTPHSMLQYTSLAFFSGISTWSTMGLSSSNKLHSVLSSFHFSTVAVTPKNIRNADPAMVCTVPSKVMHLSASDLARKSSMMRTPMLYPLSVCASSQVRRRSALTPLRSKPGACSSALCLCCFLTFRPAACSPRPSPRNLR
mmetsp:Transcript_5619/g.34840  ORF Transcript_5619/g.34840 Transcript_5619/m.34840 type:complete len:217 (-) Transcript_5619:141-791(-)